MATLKAALFDLDGVVFDTEPQYTLFWGAQCKEFHPEIPGLENQIKGQTLTQIYDKYFNGKLTEKRELITKRLDDFEQNMSFPFVEGFEAFVAELRSRNVKTAVVTSSNMAKMASVYNKVKNFASLFDAILTAEDFSRSKPDPDCYEKGAARFSANRSESIVFEDSFNGLKSGRAAGMTVVGLATTNPAEQIAPLCDLVVKDYKSIDYEECIRLLTCNR